MKLTKKDIFEEIKGYVFMVIGCIAYGASTALFLEPNGIVAGGVTGLAVLINLVFKTPISVGVWFIVINLPILILAIKSQGIKFIIRCLITIITLGLVTDLIEYLNVYFRGGDLGVSLPLTTDNVLASLYGGIFQGVGIGLFVRYQFSSGGTELLARLVARIAKGISIPICLGLLDGAIVLLGTFATSVENILYALIVVFVSTKLSETILVGLERSKLCIVISNKGEEIAKTIIEQCPRGVTKLNGQGMYTHLEHDVLLTCVKNNELTKVKKIINSIDPTAFVIINESTEVRGLGFKSLSEIDK
jgi:uncharacterized membrane-anchored protein YitT (DUF2179 family)